MEGRYWHGGFVVGWRMTAAFSLAAFFLLGLPLLVSAAERDVVITEVMWDEVEYIELYNTTDQELSLTGWTLTRQQAGGAAKTIIEFEDDEVISPQDYFLLEKTEAATSITADALAGGLTLLNTGELVTLRDQQGVVIDEANSLEVWFAGENTEVGVAMERGDLAAAGTVATSWHTSTGTGGGRQGTPGASNSEPAVNTAPEATLSGPTSAVALAVLTFSAEDSTDAESEELTYAWSFGDGTSGTGSAVTHAFSAAGSYTVAVVVADGELEDEAAATVQVTAPVYSSEIVINEFLPNPVGSDATGEFIELKNTGSESVDLSAWQLDDAEGGSNPYTIPPGISLGAGGVRSFARPETKLALNNDGDTVRLLDPAGAVKSLFAFAVSVPEGQSYNRSSAGSYVFSITVTPGAANILTAPAAEDEGEDDEEESNSVAGKVAGDAIVVVELADVREQEPGTLITAKGVVSAPPGVLGKYVMYLAGSGIQVYLSREEWPALKLGDTVEITGELSSSRGETRLKLASAADLTVARAGPPPEPHLVATGDIDEALEGWLVTVQGEVTETSGDTFYVDDGSGEVKISITESSGIDKPAMKKGVAVTITGVVSETTSGYRILPRFQEDVRLGRVAGLKSFPATGLRLWFLVVAIVDVLAIVLRSARLAREPLAFSFGKRILVV